MTVPLLAEMLSGTLPETVWGAACANAALASLLALAVWAVTSVWRSPRLAHALWLLVLVKLITPPLFDLPLPHLWNAVDPQQIPQIVDEARLPTATAPTPQLPTAPFPKRPPELAAAAEPAPHEGGRETGEPARRLPPQLEAATLATPVGGDRDASDAAGSVHAAASAAPGPRDPALADQAAAWSRRLRRGAPLACALWLLGTVAMVGTGVWRHARFSRVLRQAQPADSALRQTAADVARLLKLRQCPAVRVTVERIGPLVTFGFRTQSVLLPRWLLEEFTGPQIRSVLAHEFAHLRRRDDRVRWFELLVVSLHWWNPVAWFASRRLRQAEEECCDADVVTALPQDRRSYGAALLRIVEYLTETDASNSAPAPCAGSAMGACLLRRRIQMIMSRERPAATKRPAHWLALSLGILALPFGVHAMPDRRPIGEAVTTAPDNRAVESESPQAKPTQAKPRRTAPLETAPLATAPQETAPLEIPPAASSPGSPSVEHASTREAAAWPVRDAAQLLERLRLRDAEFRLRSLESERRWTTRVVPTAILTAARTKGPQFRPGSRMFGRSYPSLVPAPYDQAHRVPYRVTRHGENGGLLADVVIDNGDDLEIMKDSRFEPAAAPEQWPARPQIVAWNRGMMESLMVETQQLSSTRQAFEWSTGYGYSKPIVSIDKIQFGPQRIVVSGKSRVFDLSKSYVQGTPPPPRHDSEFQFELDADLIVRKAEFTLAVSPEVHHRIIPNCERIASILVATSGVARPADAPPVASEGHYQLIVKYPDEAPRAYHDDTFRFVALSAKLTDEQLRERRDPARKQYRAKD